VTERASQQSRRTGWMSARTAAWLAWSLCALCLLLMAFSLLLIVLGWSTPLPRGWTPWRDQAVFLVGFVGAPVLGGLIASRRPMNLYGWVWLGFALSIALVAIAEPYAAYALVAEPSSLLAPRTVNFILALGWGIWITFIPFILLLFPTGRLPSRRWRYLAWIVLVAGPTTLPLAFFSPEGGQGPVENPFAVGGTFGQVAYAVTTGEILIVFSAVILSAFSLVVRYRRASGVERQQLKWFALAAALTGLFIVVDLLSLDVYLGGALWNLLLSTVFAGLYVTIGIAIFRYRLYDIDRIINRTLVYGSLTLMLVLVYFGSVTATQALLRNLTGQEQLPQVVIVASTLLIAALFNPLRRRVQTFIDRRFYRRKYDAAKTLEAFSAKLRDETDLEAMNGDLVGVVRETMQPAHVSLWLRPETAPQRRHPG
jgi:hypothetical protein